MGDVSPRPARAAVPAPDDVFVSYAHEDRGRIEPLVAALERAGFAVFWDREIPPGRRWEDVLDGRLDAAPCVVVAWSAAARARDWIAIEAGRARARGSYVPVSLDGTAPSLEFSRIQATDLSAWRPEVQDDGFDALLAELRRHVAGKAAEREASAGVPWAAVASLAAGLVAGAALAAWLRLRPRPFDGALLPVVLLAAAAAGGAALHGAITCVARATGRTLRRLTAPLAAAAAAVGAAAAAYAGASADVRFAVQLQGPAGDCPPGLGEATAATLTAGGPALRAHIDARCRAVFRVPRAALGRAATLGLEAQDRWLLPADARQLEVRRQGAAARLVDARQAPRTELLMFDYQGTAEGRQRVGELYGILQEAIVNLAMRLGSGAGRDPSRYAHLRTLTVQRLGQTFDGGPGDLATTWTREHALGLLWGTVSAGREPLARSNVFIGGPGGAGEGFTLETPIDPERYKRIQDAHLTAVLYALARDARRLDFPPDVVATYLGEAASLAQDLVAHDPGDPSARALRDRVLAAAREQAEAP